MNTPRRSPSPGLDALTLDALRALCARDGLRAAARALSLPPATVARARDGGAVSRGTALAVSLALAALPGAVAA